MTKVDMTPDPSLMEDIGAGSFSVPEAIAELVANCFDARIDDKPVRVDVIVSDSEIWVIDDGKGMTEAEFPSRMRLAFKDPERAASGKGFKGMYGLGLKTACASLGREWGVFTRAPGEHQTHNFELNLMEWSRRGGSGSDSWQHEITSAESFDSSPIDEQESGTAVYVRHLRSKTVFSSAVQSRLSKAYKPHLENGDEITVNGEPLTPEEVVVREDSRVEIDEAIGPSGEYSIRGWVGVGETSNDQSFGINIYRQHQLVESWNKDWFKVHLMTSRIRGDVHLDFVPSNFHKKGLDKTSREWLVATEYMKEALTPVVALSRALSKDRKDPTREDRAFKAFDQNLSSVPGMRRVDTAGDGQAPKPGQPSPSSSSSSDEQNRPVAEIRDNRLILGREEISITRKVHAMPIKSRHWDYYFDAKKAELLVVLNSASSVYQSVDDLNFYSVLAQADVVTTFLVEKRGWKSKDARDLRDSWLTNYFEPNGS